MRIEKNAHSKTFKQTTIFAPLEDNNCYQWMRPVNLQQLLTIKSEHPAAKLVCGNSEIGKTVNHIIGTAMFLIKQMHNNQKLLAALITPCHTQSRLRDDN